LSGGEEGSGGRYLRLRCLLGKRRVVLRSNSRREGLAGRGTGEKPRAETCCIISQTKPGKGRNKGSCHPEKKGCFKGGRRNLRGRGERITCEPGRERRSSRHREKRTTGPRGLKICISGGGRFLLLEDACGGGKGKLVCVRVGLLRGVKRGGGSMGEMVLGKGVALVGGRVAVTVGGGG